MACLDFPHVVLVVVCAASLVALSDAQSGDAAVLDFDCRRMGSGCGATGSCDLTSGNCNCHGGEADYKCRAASDQNCNESMYGTDCNLNRVQVDCDGSSMFLNVNPDVTSFSGSIFVVGQEAEAGCTLVDDLDAATVPDFVENKSSLQGYQIELPHTGSVCGDAVQQNKTDNSTEYQSISRQFMVRYRSDLVTNVDQMVTAECRIVEGSTKVSSGSTVVNQTNEEFQDVDVNTDVETVTLSVRNGDGTFITAPVKLGSDIQLVFRLAPGSGKKDFNIGSCVANNTDPDEATIKTLEFIKDKCPTPGSYSLFKSSLTKFPAATTSDPVEIRINMKAFLFLGEYDAVAFVCDVVLCDGVGEGQCADGLCNGVTASENATINEPTPDPTEQPTNATDITDSNDNNSTSPDANPSNSTDATNENPSNSTNTDVDQSNTGNDTAGADNSANINGTDITNTNSTGSDNTPDAANESGSVSTQNMNETSSDPTQNTNTSEIVSTQTSTETETISTQNYTETENIPTQNYTEIENNAAQNLNDTDLIPTQNLNETEGTLTQNTNETEIKPLLNTNETAITPTQNTSNTEIINPPENMTNNTLDSSAEDASNTELSRRRRAVGNEHEQVGTIITVYDPMTQREEAINKLRRDVDQKDCMNQPEILAAIAILSIAVALLLAIVAALTFNTFRYREKEMSTQDEPKADYSFRMPRPQTRPY